MNGQVYAHQKQIKEAVIKLNKSSLFTKEELDSVRRAKVNHYGKAAPPLDKITISKDAIDRFSLEIDQFIEQLRSI